MRNTSPLNGEVNSSSSLSYTPSLVYTLYHDRRKQSHVLIFRRPADSIALKPTAFPAASRIPSRGLQLKSTSTLKSALHAVLQCSTASTMADFEKQPPGPAPEGNDKGNSDSLASKRQLLAALLTTDGLVNRVERCALPQILPIQPVKYIYIYIINI